MNKGRSMRTIHFLMLRKTCLNILFALRFQVLETYFKLDKIPLRFKPGQDQFDPYKS